MAGGLTYAKKIKADDEPKTGDINNSSSMGATKPKKKDVTFAPGTCNHDLMSEGSLTNPRKRTTSTDSTTSTDGVSQEATAATKTIPILSRKRHHHHHHHRKSRMPTAFANTKVGRHWLFGYALLVIVSCSAYLLVGFELHRIMRLAVFKIINNPEGGTNIKSSSATSTMMITNDNLPPGCHAWPGIISPQQVQQELLLSSYDNHSQPPTTGLVVSLLLGDPLLPYVCSFFPSQLAHFIVPQGLDVLMVLPKPGEPGNLGQATSKITMRALQKCLGLVPLVADDNPGQFVHQEWNNLDGSTLTTWEHRAPAYSKTTRIFLAETELQLPTYIRENTTLLDIPITPKSCQAPPSYIQGTRWYIYEMLHLQILQDYDYFIKLDADIVFVQSIPLSLLHDMHVRNAVFGHFAKYPDHVQTPCADNVARAVQEFRRRRQREFQQPQQGEEDPQQSTSTSSWNWTGDSYCSGSHPLLSLDSDRYYANFIIGRRPFFQSAGPMALGKFLSDEWTEGFFRHRWGDQAFWHFALGLFAGPNFEDHFVVDYTEFRCAPETNCWMSTQEGKRIPGASNLCHNEGGAFLHTKDVRRFANQWNRWHARTLPLERGTQPYQTKYVHDCRNSIRWK